MNFKCSACNCKSVREKQLFSLWTLVSLFLIRERFSVNYLLVSLFWIFTNLAFLIFYLQFLDILFAFSFCPNFVLKVPFAL